MILTIHNYSILYIYALIQWIIMLRKVYVADVSTFLYVYTHMFPTLYWIFNRIRWYHGIASTIFYNNEKNKIKYSKEITKETYSRNWLIKELPGIHTHHAIQRERIHVRNILHRSVANPLGTGVNKFGGHDMTSLPPTSTSNQTEISPNSIVREPKAHDHQPNMLAMRFQDDYFYYTIRASPHHHHYPPTHRPTDKSQNIMK